VIEWFVQAVRTHAEVAFFLTLGIGHVVGKLRLGAFSLGAVTGTLLAGVLVGQLGVTVSPEVKQCFFVLFLFAIGYRCGPQFFQGLRRDGLSQAALAAVVAVTGLVVAYVVALVFRYDGGTAGGLIAGSMTESATIGTAGDAIAHLPIDAAARTEMANRIPVAFAVTYLIGVVGAAWFLAQIGPRLMGVDLAKACAEYEATVGGGARRQPGIISAYRAIEARAYRVVEGSGVDGKPLASALSGGRFTLERVRRDGAVIDGDSVASLQIGDVAVISGRRDALVAHVNTHLPEVEDAELLNMPAESIDVLVTNPELHGKTLAELGQGPHAAGVYLVRLVRNKVALPITPELTVQRGDIATVVGGVPHVEAAIQRIGVADRPSDTTDMVFVSAGIVIGALVGIPAWALGKLEFGLSLSVGVLLGGLVCGWLQSLRPMMGRIPTPTLWIFESLGLTGFVAVVGRP
jgi:putative transport protein